MSPRRLKAFILLLCCVFGVACQAEEVAAVKKLREVNLFAWGGIGFAGTTSDGEIAFREVLGLPDAAEQFLAVLKQGNPAARCYALVGLRLKNRAVYEQNVKAFLTLKTEVETAAGCEFSEQPMGTVVASIHAGDFDKLAQPKAEPKR